MPKAIIKPNKSVRTNRRPKDKLMTNAEIFQKIIADQKFIRDAIQSGVSFQELKDKYGYKFATV